MTTTPRPPPLGSPEYGHQVWLLLSLILSFLPQPLSAAGLVVNGHQVTAVVSQSATPFVSKGNQCYRVPTSISEIFPPVALNFAGGASMVLRPVDYLIPYGFVDGAAMWCIGFQKVQDPGVTILGGIEVTGQPK